MMRRLTAILSLALITGCMQIGLGAANLPAKFTPSDQKITDIAYGENPAHRLDIYKPVSHVTGKSPVVIFFHGGRWTEGDKKLYAFVGRWLSKNGYIAVLPNYRHYPSVKFPDFIKDTAQAVAWVHDNIARYGGDPASIQLMGHSSGAHMAALVATDGKYLAAFNKDRSVIKGFVGLAGPYNFTPDEPDLVDMFGPPARYPQMQVSTFVDGHQPPMLLLHGSDDTLVKSRNQEILAQTIREKGGIVVEKLYQGINHVNIIASMIWFYPDRARIGHDILAFLKAHQ